MRKSFSLLLLAALVSGTFLAACGGKESGEAEKSSLDKLAEAAEDMSKAAEEMATGASEEREPQPAVSFRVLMDFLPKSFHDLQPGEPEGESASYGNWNFSTAKVKFTGLERSFVEVEVFDYAYISMLYASFRMMWKMNFNRESSKGYERTVEIAGWPAIEKWEVDAERAEATALVGDRFIVTVKSRFMPEDTPRQMLEMMDLQELASKKAATPPA
jgi:uncharacterized protein YbjQ (UPF0145 family)